MPTVTNLNKRKQNHLNAAILPQNNNKSIENYKLTQEAKTYIIKAASRFEFPRVILQNLEAEFGITIDRTSLFRFQQRHKDKIQRLQDLWIDKISDEPFAHKRKRINELQKLYTAMQELYMEAQKVSERTTIAKRMQDILNQARIEMEGQRITFSGQMLHKVDDDSLQAKVEQIMKLREVPEAEVVE